MGDIVVAIRHVAVKTWNCEEVGQNSKEHPELTSVTTVNHRVFRALLNYCGILTWVSCIPPTHKGSVWPVDWGPLKVQDRAETGTWVCLVAPVTYANSIPASEMNGGKREAQRA